MLIRRHLYIGTSPWCPACRQTAYLSPTWITRSTRVEMSTPRSMSALPPEARHGRLPRLYFKDFMCCVCCGWDMPWKTGPFCFFSLTQSSWFQYEYVNTTIIKSIIKCGVELLIHSVTWTAAPLKFRNGSVISSHTSLGIWLFMHQLFWQILTTTGIQLQWSRVHISVYLLSYLIVLFSKSNSLLYTGSVDSMCIFYKDKLCRRWWNCVFS